MSKVEGWICDVCGTIILDKNSYRGEIDITIPFELNNIVFWYEDACNDCRIKLNIAIRTCIDDLKADHNKPQDDPK